MTTQGVTRSSAVFEANERTWQEQVVARSHDVPVVVDFWAPWCGPCRALGPTLERLAHEAGGAWVLAKVNVDENPRLSQSFGIQGIPAVKAIGAGRVIAEFTGALPESQVRAWLKEIVPSEADELTAAAAAIEATNPDEAEARYRLALGSDPSNPAALFGLGRLLTLHGDAEGPLVLSEIPPGTPFSERALGLAQLSDLLAAEPATDNPADLASQYARAAQLTRQAAYGPALDALLAIVEHDRRFRDDAARKAMLGIFALLGDEDPLVPVYRRKLANALF